MNSEMKNIESNLVEMRLFCGYVRMYVVCIVFLVAWYLRNERKRNETQRFRTTTILTEVVSTE